jgi:hypothetical protein
MAPNGWGYMTSDPLTADFPISHNPGHPSMHTTHIPEKGDTSSPNRFFVPVAALLLGLLNDILLAPFLSVFREQKQKTPAIGN